MSNNEAQRFPTAEQRLAALDIRLPAPPQPFGAYVESVQVNNVLYLTGMLPTAGREVQFFGRVGAELDVQTGRQAAHLAAMNGIALVREHLGSLDRVKRIVRLGVSIVTAGDFREHPKVADGASELLQAVFGAERNPCRVVVGVASLPLGAAVELELIFEVEPS
ncbi:RidA family protein [Scleromatobacter humisilvae]|uniref:RidA family protein n=1 Tax=Scleromatobacter humisilvae TaxID=2897159 RepID=A0A9X1YT71_9BURK|nr:RidA family protein [Scleromatobacter humisilvae]MCK9689451.1 RidA family protein [Scleromatobacter humisilvae]